MAITLIPINSSIYEQFKARDEFIALVKNWCKADPNFYKISTIELLKASGVRCWYVGDNLAGFELLDQEAYMMFKLKWVQ
jgi:hypothetical protein